MGSSHPKHVVDENALLSRRKNKQEADPSVFNFYVYLRTHPMIMRQQITKTAQKDSSTKAIMLSDSKEKVVAWIRTTLSGK